jgi:glycosyltransferase involved in cell wall biosynthesis
MKKIIEHDPNVILLLIGDGPDKKILLNYCKENGLLEYVRIINNISNDEIPQYHVASDIAILPSSKASGVEEGSSLFLIESMAMGLPVIATDIGGNRDTIRNNDNGILVEDTSFSIAEGIIKLLEDKNTRKRLSESAKAYAVNERDWSKLIKKIQIYYDG